MIRQSGRNLEQAQIANRQGYSIRYRKKQKQNNMVCSGYDVVWYSMYKKVVALRGERREEQLVLLHERFLVARLTPLARTFREALDALNTLSPE